MSIPPQPSFVRDDDVDPTNEAHDCQGSSGSSFFLLPLSSSSPHPSNITKHSSVLLQGVHDSHYHDAPHLFQNLSLLDNTNPDTFQSIGRRKLALSRLPTSSRSGSKNEQKVRKSVIQKKRTALRFSHYRHPGAMAAITSAMEALNTKGENLTDAQPVTGLDHGLVIRLKYKSPDTATTSTTAEQHATNASPAQHQHVTNRNIMRIDSVLNGNLAQTMSSPPPSSFDPSVATASTDDASPSSPQAAPLSILDHSIERTNTDTLGPMPNNNDNDNTANVCSRFTKSDLRQEYIEMLTHPERQRYEDALVEIVGDLELPFLGNQFGARHE